jgi:hypothetical protein
MGAVGEPQFSCKVELSQNAGVSIIVKDSKQKDAFKRTIVMARGSITIVCKNGAKTTTVTQKDDSIQLKVEGEAGTTTVDQDAETIAVKCKTFKVDAETIALKATGDGSFDTDGKVRIASLQDATVQSSAQLTIKSVQKMTVHSDTDIAGSAGIGISLEAVQAKVSASGSLELQSQGTAKLSAMAVDVQGNATAALEAPMTSMGGQGRTTVNGGIVQVSGGLVQLG